MTQTQVFSTYTPEFQAVAGLLERREKLYLLQGDLLRQEKITQTFLKRFMQEVLDAWFDLEDKTEMALKASGKHREIAVEAMLKADNALRATDVVIEMGKIMGGTLHPSPVEQATGGPLQINYVEKEI